VGSLLVAEGVEYSAELRVLGELGVPLVQGFYTGRPARPWPQSEITSSPVALDPAPLADMVPIDAMPASAAAPRSLLPA
jgi:EAL domain-containing protein (putative c-di-GMP-specific phosphodiesterase class I)